MHRSSQKCVQSTVFTNKDTNKVKSVHTTLHKGNPVFVLDSANL